MANDPSSYENFLVWRIELLSQRYKLVNSFFTKIFPWRKKKLQEIDSLIDMIDLLLTEIGKNEI